MRKRSPTKTSLHQLAIVDGDALRHVLGVVLTSYGSHRAAAGVLDVTQSNYTRLLNGITRQRIRSDTFHKILTAFRQKPELRGLFEWPFEAEELLESSVVSPEGRLAKGRYEAWCSREYQRMHGRVGPIVQKLYGHPDYRHYFVKFMERLTHRADLPRPEDQRLWLALYRAVEPLAAAAASGGVELEWDELAQAQKLDRFLRISLERELIMLAREHDTERFRQARRQDDLAPELSDSRWEQADASKEPSGGQAPESEPEPRSKRGMQRAT